MDGHVQKLDFEMEAFVWGKEEEREMPSSSKRSSRMDIESHVPKLAFFDM